MKLHLPDATGSLTSYRLRGSPISAEPTGPNPTRRFLAAAHVTIDPFADPAPGEAAIDWKATMRFRRHLADLGLGIAEAMDTAQRGMGLDWPSALELIRQTRTELPDAVVFNGSGTDQLDLAQVGSVDAVRDAYLEQVSEIQTVGGRVIMMASRALARVAEGPDDYARVYGDVLSACDAPVILHWLGEMFDPALAGYWGASRFEDALETVLGIISANQSGVDGIKLSLLDKEAEITLRRRLPAGVRMYTGDDFNYPDLIAGDEVGHSDALLGIFDPLAETAVRALNRLSAGDTAGFRAILDPTEPLARHLFRAPTQHYKTGVVFLAWLNGFQDHFVMLNGAQSARSLPYFCACFRMADQIGLLRNPDLAVGRMRRLLAVYGVA